MMLVAIVDRSYRPSLSNWGERQ